MAKSYLLLGYWHSAIDALENSLKIKEKYFESDDVEVAVTLVAMAQAMRAKKEWQSALRLLTRAKTIFVRNCADHYNPLMPVIFHEFDLISKQK